MTIIKLPFWHLALGLSAFLISRVSLDKTQLVGNRIPFVLDPQDQYFHGVAVDQETGNYFLFWTKQNYRVYGRLFGPKGWKIAPLQSFAGETVPGLIRLDSGHYAVFNPFDKKYFVTWHVSYYEDLYEGPIAWEKRGQFVSSDGRAIGTSWIISKGQLFYWRKMLRNSRDNQYVLFYSLVPNGDETQRKLYLHRLDAQGRLFGKARKINPPPGDLAGDADVAYDSKNNQYLVAWGPAHESPGLVKYRAVSADLQTLGPVYDVENTLSTYSQPRTLYDSYKKRFIIIWKNEAVLKLRGITLSGTPQTDVRSLGRIDFRDYNDDLMADINSSTGSLLFAYIAKKGGDPLTLFRIDTKFSRLGEPFYGSSQFDNRTREPTLCFSRINQEFMLIWSYIDRGPNSLDIYGQRVRGVPLTGAQDLK